MPNQYIYTTPATPITVDDDNDDDDVGDDDDESESERVVLCDVRLFNLTLCAESLALPAS